MFTGCHHDHHESVVRNTLSKFKKTALVFGSAVIASAIVPNTALAGDYDAGSIIAEASPFAEIHTLEPGEFLWHPERAGDGEVHAYVDLGAQLVHVYRGDTRIAVSTISSGMPGHETPAGRFEILQKRVEHYSNLYNNAPMPFMQRLTWDGIAFHVGKLPGTPASHGCIRLPREFASSFYEIMEMGGVVEIAGEAGIENPSLAGLDFRAAPLTERAETAALNEAAANGTLNLK